MSTARVSGSGPFRVDQLSAPSSYELSDGHALLCHPTAPRGGASAVAGAVALRTDPAVVEAGVEVGHRLGDKTLRAPDLSIGNVPAERPGWAEGAPPLAVEYADTGQDNPDFEVKVQELLAAGTRYLWVVRLTGPRRVEVHEPSQPMRVVDADGVLTAPGVLQNPVPVAALYDRKASLDVALRNLLQRQGYPDLDAVREEGRLEGEVEGELRGRLEGRLEGELEGRAAALLTVFATRGLPVSEAQRARIRGCSDPATLDCWLTSAATGSSTREVLGE